MPYLRGDSIGALRWAKRFGFKFVDQNALLDANGRVWVMHWPLYAKQYRWIASGVTKSGREIRVPVPSHWPDRVQQLATWQVAKLRSAKRGGVRPHQARVHMAAAAKLGLVLCLEVKRNHRSWQVSSQVWNLLAEQRDHIRGARVGIMTLQNQPGGTKAAREVLAMASGYGFPTALLPRGAKPTHDDWVRNWAPHDIRWWGKGRP